ncbi:bifunctional glycosyltransferase/CDP-glycerol:glycerophosphate glycerophosphotransferase, partial [Streptomyces albidoflavus]|uniref:bifunctional glycosyltransferase/CDP-glycerol:glycerophosphate glycerophosphotransferase n=1 Tax=Streptomyces albidoflavus TaxID=1886 RepID=UPI000D1991E6
MTPRLTVVVPVYNVEEYLDACLASLGRQTMRDLEVVMVDDGSTDSSARIAQAHAARDSRFRLVQQENAGLGAARNTGVRHATGEYLAFVDSDDVIPEDAYALMLDTLERSGSDFVTGNVHRLKTDGTTEQSPMFRRAMSTTRPTTHVLRDWDLLGDRIACNKVFRKDFWDKHALAFPEGVLFEDIPVIVPAHFLAGSVDVLSDTVYLWRDRHGSISNKRALPRAVHDRTAAVTTASTFLGRRLAEAAGTPFEADWAEAKRRYDQSVLAGDLWMFMEALPDGDDAYHQAFLDHANAFADHADPAALAALPLHLRAKWALIRRRRLPELLDLMAFVRANPDAFQVRGLARRRAAYPVTRAHWEDGKLHLTGYAYVRNLPPGRLQARGKALWLRAGRHRVVPLKVRPVRSREATYSSRQALHRYDRAGFTTVVDPARLSTGRPSTTWKLEMAAVGGLLPRTGPVRMAGLDGLPVHYLGEFRRVGATLSAGRLRLRAENVPSRLAAHHDEDGTLHLEGHLAATPPTGAEAWAGLRATNWYTKETLDLPIGLDGKTFTAELPLAALAEGAEPLGPDAPVRRPQPWGVSLFRADGTTSPVAVHPEIESGRYPLGEGRELLVGANSAGNLELRDQPVRPIVTELTWPSRGPLTLAGSFPAADDERRELVLVHGTHGEETVLDAHRDGPRFTASLTPEAVHGPGGTLPLAEGNWTMFLRRPGEADPALYTPVHIAPVLHTGLPLARHLGGREFLVERRHYDRLQLHSGSSLPAADRGRTQQKALRAAYTTQRARGPLRDAVLYSSFDGRQYSDSPRAVHEELAARDTSLTHLWTVRDQQVDLPPGLTPVALWSAEWYEALARSRHIVTNTQLPEWFERAEGQYVVQTWHGTPLKRIGRDLAGSPAADPHYIAALPHRSAQWSLLVSPNRFSTPILRHAFGYTGPVLESGYPRNDLLDAHGRAERAARVRRRLAIPEDRTVVLYAPTWREDRPKRGGRYGLDLPLDPARAAAELGDGHVLLVRRHYLVGGSVPGGDNVRDVSRYPDVAELLLISDVLVTDYSSLMFDFAQTGRPMLFHTWDLDHYRDTLRGFYFDFESSAPGPLLTHAEEVVEALRDPKAATAGHREAYDAFRARFCDLDDGTAAARVADIVTNTQLPEWFERAEGQYVVQTWHGTPLKRIGRDLAGSPAA